MMRKARFAALLALLLLSPVVARAHIIRVSTLKIFVGDTEVALEAPLVPIDILSDSTAAVQNWNEAGRLDETGTAEAFAYFRERMIVTESGVVLPFELRAVRVARVETGGTVEGGTLTADTGTLDHLVLAGRFARTTPRGRIEIDAGNLFAELGEYPPIPIARIRAGSHTYVHPFDGMDNWREPPPEPTWRRWLRFFAFVGTGITHIFSGYDHVLFLLALHLVSPSFRETLKIATAFTISHSITLALAATNVLVVPQSVASPFIALTIVWVGVENLLYPAPKGRWKTAFLFGFIHGVGFASAFGGALDVAEMGRAAFAVALLSFNVGIEIGQIVVVGALAPFWVGVRWIPRRREITIGGSLLISLAGLVWFLSAFFS